MDAEHGILSVGCPLRDFDSGDAAKRPNEDGSARKSWGCEAIRPSNGKLGDDLAVAHIEGIERPIGETVNGMTTYHRRADNVTGGVPALVHMPARVNSDLAHSIRAGNKRR